mmetsp:Transcript_32987/g.71388  ORF Transcript_32987/g.71388 Transcript_32987/m.71388 type:complete len:409 (+) Transcript_32987:207-1433(+)
MMREGLTQRAGYPRQPQTFLDLPRGEEDELAAAYASPPGKKHDQAPIRKGGRQEPWLVRKIEAFSKASLHTKATYVWLLLSLAIAWTGFRGIRHGHASVWLTCTSKSCQLEITPPGPPKVTRITILREQIIRSDVVKVDADGEVVRVLEGTAASGVMPHRYTSANKKKRGKATGRKHDLGDKGPDEDGNYDSYVLVIREDGADTSASAKEKEDGINGEGEGEGEGVTSGGEDGRTQRKPGEHPTNKLEPLNRFIEPNDIGEYIFHMRRFNLGQSRRKALSTVTRINSYVRNRRHKLAVRETKHVAWQAIVAIVFGLFSLILSLLCGQFFEPEHVHSVIGPGTRSRSVRSADSRPRRAPPAAAGLYTSNSSSSPSNSRRGPGGNNYKSNSGYGAYGGYRQEMHRQKRCY